MDDTEYLALLAATSAESLALSLMAYLDTPPPNGDYGVSVNWSWGSNNCPQAVKELIAIQINSLMPTLLQNTADSILADADNKKANVYDKLSAKQKS